MSIGIEFESLLLSSSADLRLLEKTVHLSRRTCPFRSDRCDAFVYSLHAAVSSSRHMIVSVGPCAL